MSMLEISYILTNLINQFRSAQSLQLTTSFNLTHCFGGVLFCFIIQGSLSSRYSAQYVAWDLDKESPQLRCPRSLSVTLLDKWLFPFPLSVRSASLELLHAYSRSGSLLFMCGPLTIHFTIHPGNYFYLTLSRFLCVHKRTNSIRGTLQFTQSGNGVVPVSFLGLQQLAANGSFHHLSCLLLSIIFYPQIPQSISLKDKTSLQKQSSQNIFTLPCF